MKALVFNSGLGSRLGDLTAHSPKCLVQLANGETILHRQLRILVSCGIREFIITTGPWPEQLREVAFEFEEKGCHFSFVNNDEFDQTNYIHSMWLARNYLHGDDILLLHGDLVFDADYVKGLLSLPEGSWASVNSKLPLPEKDFKARVIDGEIREVGVDIWDDNCVAFQAMYRLTTEAMGLWIRRVEEFEARNETKVYAENAANEVFEQMHVAVHSYAGHVLEEVDTPEDLARVSALIRARDFADQPVFEYWKGDVKLVEGLYARQAVNTPIFEYCVEICGWKRPLVVTDRFFTHDDLEKVLGPGKWATFQDFTPNPTYEQVLRGLRFFWENKCDSIISIGGGSAIDVAKCIKLWAKLSGDGTSVSGNSRFCDQISTYSDTPHMAIPSTAGTGSESTHFAVIYVEGEKRSIEADCIQPDAVVLAPELLSGLSDYQKKATMLDALCQAVESHWSVASCEASREYSAKAITMIMGCWEAYLAGETNAALTMHRAANLSGKAINLTTTTLAHAMSYKLTSLYGIAHGHAVALCMPFAWNMLLQKGSAETEGYLRELDRLMTGGSEVIAGAGLNAFLSLYNVLDLPDPKVNSEADFDMLATSVNPQRMSNYPLRLSTHDIKAAYREILRVSQ